MAKHRFFICVLVVVFMLICVTGYSQEDMVAVDNSVFDSVQRAQAVFKHDEHNEKAELENCNVCHHLYQDGQLLEDESSEDQSCSDCHKLKKSGDTPGLMKAFHSSCWGCHKSKNAGPLMCGECHIKEK